jgi:hypothetical protein
MSKKINTKCKQLNGTRCKDKEIAEGKQSDASGHLLTGTGRSKFSISE